MHIDQSHLSEIRSGQGHQLGFRLQSRKPGKTIMVAGIHASVRSVFQQVLHDPNFRIEAGVLKLIVIDRPTTLEATSALKEFERIEGKYNNSVIGSLTSIVC